MKNRKTQFGRSMIEMLGVLAVVGVLSVAGLVGFSKMVRSYRVSDAADYVKRVKVEIYTREAQGHIVSGQPYRCDVLIGQPMPSGMTGCQYQNQYFPGRLFVRFTPGELLKDFGKKMGTHNLYNYTDEELTSGQASFLSYRPGGQTWWSEYYKFSAYIN